MNRIVIISPVKTSDMVSWDLGLCRRFIDRMSSIGYEVLWIRDLVAGLDSANERLRAVLSAVESADSIYGLLYNLSPEGIAGLLAAFYLSKRVYAIKAGTIAPEALSGENLARVILWNIQEARNAGQEVEANGEGADHALSGASFEQGAKG
jgi:hypothetical protein